MKATWFEEAVATWPGAGTWTATRIRRAASLYREISLANGGEVAEPASLDEGRLRRHALAAADDVLDARARRLARALTGSESTEGYSEDLEPVGGLAFLGRSRWAPRLNLNAASASELSALPVLGPKLSEALVSHREARGPFSDLEALAAIRGLGDKGIEQLRRYVYPGREVRPLPRTDALVDFLAAPRFLSLVDYYDRTGYGFHDHEKRSAYELTRTELEDALARRRASGRPRLARASDILARDEIDERAEAVASGSATDVQYSTLLLDGNYLPFLGSLLAKSRRSVRMLMFLMSYDESRQHPSNRIVARLIAAHRRGVDVRVILDIDTAFDVYNTRKANKAAFQKLKSAGVRIKRDKKRTLLHAKSIVVDDEHVVIGSHNLTRGSAEVYDDTSCYLRSKSLAATSNDRFDKLWRQLR